MKNAEFPTMLALLAALVFASTMGDRVAVIVHDPGGRGDELALSVVQRLRAEGWDAYAVAPSAAPTTTTWPG